MGTGYTRNDTANNIADGNVINASDLDGEYNAIEAAFNESTGHTHDGTSAEGAPITKVGPVQDVEVSATAIQPKTASAGNIDLGASGAQFKDLYVDGLAYIDGLGENLLVGTTNEIQFRDSALKINSSADGQLDIDADTELELTAPTVDINASTSVNISNDLKLDSDSAILSLGADGEVTLSHIHNVGTELKVENATTSSVTDILDLQVESSGTPAVGIGTGLTFSVETAGGNVETAGAIRAVATGLTPTAEELDLVFSTMRNGSLTEAFRFDSINDSLSLADNVKATFGAGDDLQIYHDGSDSYVSDQGTGNLKLQGSAFVLLQDASGTNMLRAKTGEFVDLYYNGSAKLATTNTGIDVTGTVTADGLTVESGATNIGIAVSSTDANSTISFSDSTTVTAPQCGANGDQFRIITSNTPRVYVESDGNVGIGNSSPSFPLDISGSDFVGIHYERSGTDSPAFRLSNATTGSLAQIEGSNSGDMIFKNGAGTLSESVRIDSSGNVGIGTSSPQFKADFIVDNNDAIAVRPATTTLNATQTALRLYGHESVLTSRYVEIASANGAGTDANNMVFKTATGTTVAERMRITDTGNVGIGTSSPAETLHIQSAVPVIRLEDTGHNGYSEIIGSTTGSLRFSADVTNVDAGSYVGFEVDGSEAMRIDSSGNVGIGTTGTPPGKVWVVNGSDSDYIFRVDGANATSEYIALGVQTGEAVITAGGVGSTSTGLIFKTAPSGSETEAMRIDSSGNVGIGTSSPAAPLDIRSGTAGASTTLVSLSHEQSGSTGAAARLTLGLNSTSRNAYIEAETTSAGNSHDLIFATNGGGASPTERMRIDSSGNVLVGKTSYNTATQGFQASSTGQVHIGQDGGAALYVNRNTNDGNVLVVRKNGANVGQITSYAGDMTIGTGDTGLWFRDGSDDIIPFDTSTNVNRDNAIDLGDGAAGRFDDIYATNGTIQTSDRNEKQDIEELSEAEQRVAVACKGLMRKYRWKDAVAEKGDDARIHFGIIAQDLQAAFEAEGLDAGRYAMFIHSTWTDEETGEERSRMGVRYSELLAFIIAAI